MNSHLTTADVAALLGISRRRVVELVAAGRFTDASKYGRDWVIPRYAVEAFRRRPSGRPRTIRANNAV